MTTRHVKLRQTFKQRCYEQDVTLDGVRVRLRSTYSIRTDRWYVSIFDTTDTLIVGSLAVVPGVDLLLPYKHLAIPQGQLFAYARDREPPTFVTADVGAVTLYREEEEG